MYDYKVKFSTGEVRHITAETLQGCEDVIIKEYLKDCPDKTSATITNKRGNLIVTITKDNQVDHWRYKGYTFYR